MNDNNVTALPVRRAESQAPMFEKKTVSIASKLEELGLITPVSFDLDPEISIDEWALLGVWFGKMSDAVRWWLGDWVNWGEKVYGEMASQYMDEDGGILGLKGVTVREYARVAEHIAVKNRRDDIGFGWHREVYNLEPDEQVRWLAAAVENKWTRDQLRRAIKEDGQPEPEGKQVVLDPPTLSRAEQIEEAASRVYHQSQKGRDGKWVTDDEYMVQLGSAIGELD